MGYTHYWYRPDVLDKTIFQAFAADAQKIMNAENDNIVDPLVDGDSVIFDGSCETLYIPQTITEDMKRGHSKAGELRFQFCKTNNGAYDRCVVAVLTALKHHFPEVQISSDGGRTKSRDISSLAGGIAAYTIATGNQDGEELWSKANNQKAI